MNYRLIIGWLYPELMSTYGDRGNIICLHKRCKWRGIDVELKNLDLGFKTEDIKNCDLLFMGGAQDQQQKIVSQDLRKKKDTLKEMIKQDVPGVYICGAYQFLGKYYKEADGTIIDGLGILDLYTENPGEKDPRLIGNIAVEVHNLILYSYKTQTSLYSLSVNKESPLGWDSLCTRQVGTQNDNISSILVGFENHGGRTYLGENVKPFGKVFVGFGNNGEDKTEGAVFKNSFGSYLHGPILPKNPHFADYLIKLALEKKYKRRIELKALDDSLEWKAHKFIAKRLGVKL